MGISQLGGSASSRLITKSGSTGGIILPNATGISVSASSSDQTFGSWAQIVASTSQEYLLTGLTARVVSALNGQYGPLIVDVGTGGSGSETTIATVTIFGAQPNPAAATATILGGTRDIVPLRVPASTRLAIRAAIHLANGAAAGVIVILNAIPYANLE